MTVPLWYRRAARRPAAAWPRAYGEALVHYFTQTSSISMA